MLPEKFHHLDKAKALLVAGDRDSLRYCCLELRTCIELVAYERIPMFEKELPLGFEKWQPKEVLEALVDCDPDADKGFSLAVGIEGSFGEPPAQMMSVGTFVPLTRKFIQRHYHKLGAFLHAPTYSQIRDGKEPTPDRGFLEETLAAVERLCSSTVNANLRKEISLTCEDCGTLIVRNADALRRDREVTCLNPACKAVYTVQSLDPPMFKMVQASFNCLSCTKRIFVSRHRLQSGSRVACPTCGARLTLAQVWAVALEQGEATKPPSEEGAPTPEP